MSISLHKVSKELNVGIKTILSICNQHNIEVNPSLNSIISDEDFEIIKEGLSNRPLRILPWVAEPFTDDGETNSRIINSHGWNTFRDDFFFRLGQQTIAVPKRFSRREYIILGH